MSYKQDLSLPNENKWKAKMQEELESMWENQVWDLVDLPAGRKTIGNKWVLKIKCNSDGSIERYKARLVAKGYTQRERVLTMKKPFLQWLASLHFARYSRSSLS